MLCEIFLTTSAALRWLIADLVGLIAFLAEFRCNARQLPLLCRTCRGHMMWPCRGSAKWKDPITQEKDCKRGAGRFRRGHCDPELERWCLEQRVSCGRSRNVVPILLLALGAESEIASNVRTSKRSIASFCERPTAHQKRLIDSRKCSVVDMCLY